MDGQGRKGMEWIKEITGCDFDYHKSALCKHLAEIDSLTSNIICIKLFAASARLPLMLTMIRLLTETHLESVRV